MIYIVTIKRTTRNPDHDPKNKKTGECPASPAQLCTDMTGEHHSYLVRARSATEIFTHLSNEGVHVTRIECALPPMKLAIQNGYL